jgi:hypothetical protein
MAVAVWSKATMRNPTDFKRNIAIQPNPEMTRAGHLKRLEEELITLYTSLDGWDEFGPDKIPLVYNIQQKLLIYGKIYETLGELAGECERFGLWCDAHKKNEYEKYMTDHKDGTDPVKYKEINANIAGKKYRVNRDYFNGLAGLWRNRMETTKEQINILKWMIRDAHESMKGN